MITKTYDIYAKLQHLVGEKVHVVQHNLNDPEDNNISVIGKLAYVEMFGIHTWSVKSQRGQVAVAFHTYDVSHIVEMESIGYIDIVLFESP